MEYCGDFSLLIIGICQHGNSTSAEAACCSQHLPHLFCRLKISSRSPAQPDSHKEKAAACENRHKKEVIESAFQRTRSVIFKGNKFCTHRGKVSIMI